MELITVEVHYFNKNGGRGNLTIWDVEQYLMEMPIAKIKKMLNLIRFSQEPEQVEHFEHFCKCFLDGYELTVKSINHEISAASDKVTLKERYVKECTIVRNRYKKGSDGYKHHMENLKKYREELQTAKCDLRYYQTKLNQTERAKEKLGKVLEYPQL